MNDVIIKTIHNKLIKLKMIVKMYLKRPLSIINDLIYILSKI